MAKKRKQERTGRYVRRRGWTHDDYRAELFLLSVEDVSIFATRPELGLTRPCRVWTGQISEKGYGVYGVLGENRAHRVSHVLHNRNGEPMPKELQTCHRCDVRNCIEPTHLFEGTSEDNVHDALDKGRMHRVARGRFAALPGFASLPGEGLQDEGPKTEKSRGLSVGNHCGGEGI